MWERIFVSYIAVLHSYNQCLAHYRCSMCIYEKNECFELSPFYRLKPEICWEMVIT